MDPHLDIKLSFLKADKADQALHPVPALCTPFLRSAPRSCALHPVPALCTRDLSQQLSLGRKGPSSGSSVIPEEIRAFQGCQGDLCVCVSVCVCMCVRV